MSCENCANAYDEGYTAGHNAENARLCAQVSILEAGRCTSCMEPINPLHQQCACSRAEFEMLYHQLNETDTLRTQAEVLATALEATKQTAGQLLTLKEATGDMPADLAALFVSTAFRVADAALRAYREGDCPGCSFRRQTGGHHDDVPTGDADPNCPYREGS